MPANPLATNLQAYLAQLNQSDAGQSSQLVGFITHGGAIRPVPGDTVPYAGAVAAASEDGQSGIKPATTNGDNVKILADLYGRLFTVIAPELIDATTSATGETQRERAGKHTLVEYAGLNLNGATAYLMVFDSAALPADGTVPALTALPVATGELGTVDLAGTLFTNGISVAFSSTPLTLTVMAGLSSFTIGYR